MIWGKKGKFGEQRGFLERKDDRPNIILYSICANFGLCVKALVFLKYCFVFMLYPSVPLNCGKCANTSYSKGSISYSINVNMPLFNCDKVALLV